MKLEKLSYFELPGQPAEWGVDEFTLGQINLVVGRNAVGKTRLLNVISSVGRLLSGEMKEVVFSGRYKAYFTDGSNSWDYSLDFDNFDILRELLLYNTNNVMQRGKGGIGQIEAEDVAGKTVRLKFKVPLRQVGLVTKRDSIQHPYLDKLYEWGTALRHFQFGSEMCTNNLAFAVRGFQVKIDEKNTSALVPILNQALSKYGDEREKSVIADMETLGYYITDFAIRKPENAIIEGVLPGELVGVSAKERDLDAMTDQPSMSQGMFRSLSLLIQTTYYSMSNQCGCIVIDDIGEGLDFERSCTLIDIIRKKAQQSSFQLVMSTNNRFVMNRVPLEEWCVLERDKGRLRVRNYANSNSAFEQFKVTGLNNFDLLATNYLVGR